MNTQNNRAARRRAAKAQAKKVQYYLSGFDAERFITRLQ